MDPKFLTRLELARRWKVSIDTLKRREHAKILRPVRLDGRVIRYRLRDVLRIEEEGYAGGGRLGCMLIKKPLERRCGNRLRRMPCNLPTLKRLKFCRQSRRVEEFHCLGLAKGAGLSTGFESLNNP